VESDGDALFFATRAVMVWRFRLRFRRVVFGRRRRVPLVNIIAAAAKPAFSASDRSTREIFIVRCD